MKRGFTLIEIIISMIIASIIGSYIMMENSKNSFHTDVSKFANSLAVMVDAGITHSDLGYPSNANVNCGGGGDYTDITAERVQNCVGWNYTIGGAIGAGGTDGKLNYFTGVNMLGTYAPNGCQVYVDEDGVDPKQFFLYVDCSNLNYQNEARYRKYLEDRIAYVFYEQFGGKLLETNRDAQSVDPTVADVANSDSDGKIRLKLEI